MNKGEKRFRKLGRLLILVEFIILSIIVIFYSDWFYLSAAAFIACFFLLYIHYYPKALGNYIKRIKKDKVILLIDVSKIFFGGIIELLILANLLTGTDLGLSRIFFMLISMIVFITYYQLIWKEEIKKYLKKENWFRNMLIASTFITGFIGLQTAAPIFFPKIDLTLNPEIIQGSVEGGNTYIWQLATVEVYPALFTIQGLTNCQEIQIGPIKNIRPTKIITSVRIEQSASDRIKVCTNWNVDAWKSNRISIPVYIENSQSFSYEYEPNITFVDRLQGADKEYNYAYLHFNNGNNDFPIYIKDPVFYIFYNTSAWNTLSELNCNIHYTENSSGFSSSNQRNGEIFFIGNNKYNNSMEIKMNTIFLDKWGSKNGYLIFDCKPQENNKMVACDSFSYENCPEQCVVCPPCEFCSSMACRSEEFCLSIGFNRSWYEDIKTRLPNTSG